MNNQPSNAVPQNEPLVTISDFSDRFERFLHKLQVAYPNSSDKKEDASNAANTLPAATPVAPPSTKEAAFLMPSPGIKTIMQHLANNGYLHLALTSGNIQEIERAEKKQNAIKIIINKWLKGNINKTVAELIDGVEWSKVSSSADFFYYSILHPFFLGVKISEDKYSSTLNFDFVSGHLNKETMEKRFFANKGNSIQDIINAAKDSKCEDDTGLAPN